MKIAHVVSTFSPRLGGMGRICLEEAAALARQGHEVTVFTLNYPHFANDEEFVFKVVRLHPLIRLGDAGLVPQLLWKLGKNFDLVHLHYPFYGGAEWLCFLPIPLVITYHMDAQARGFKGFAQKMYDWVWPKFLFAKAKKIITVDAEHFNNSKFFKNIPANKVVEIANGVDTAIFKPAPPNLEKLELEDLKDKKIILFVGNPMPLKRLDLLIAAVKLLDNKDTVLLVVGGGYELEKYKQMAKELQVEAQIRFIGPCADQIKLAEYYNVADCVAVPSDYESFSLVAIEAMACGKPLVISDLPGLKNRTSEALFFAPGSVESLVGALKKVLALSDEERKKIGDSEVAKAIQDFSWDKHIDKLLQVYGRV